MSKKVGDHLSTKCISRWWDNLVLILYTLFLLFIWLLLIFNFRVLVCVEFKNEHGKCIIEDADNYYPKQNWKFMIQGTEKNQTCEETKQVNLLHDCVKLQCIQIPVLLFNLQILWRGSNIYFPILIIVKNVFQMDLKWLKWQPFLFIFLPHLHKWLLNGRFACYNAQKNGIWMDVKYRFEWK